MRFQVSSTAADNGTTVRRDGNLYRRLVSREIHRRGASLLSRQPQPKFAHLRLQAELDPHEDHDGEAQRKLAAHLRKRTKVVELIAVGRGLMVSLTQSGVCAVFDRQTGKRICFVNITPDEVIRSLFFNKANQSLITVSVFRGDYYSSLRCRNTLISSIRSGRPELDATELFANESLHWPGFVEFDDVNDKIVTYSASQKRYKIWDLRSYQLLYTLSNPNISEVKITPGVMLIIYQRAGPQLAVDVCAVESAELLASLQFALHRTRRIDFVEQFQEKLLLKQENETLQIWDIRDRTKLEVSAAEFPAPTAFIFLHENQRFLTFRDRQIAVWNLRGECVTRFDDHVLYHAEWLTATVYITTRQDLIVSYCKNQQTYRGEIHVSELLTGRCLSRIASETDTRNGSNNASFRSGDPLLNITALWYNEDTHEIYSGSADGLVHVWSA